MAKKQHAEDTEATGEFYTYVGGGEDSPRVVNFMGLQEFVRGEATEVTDSMVLAKIKNHPCFIQGEADQKALHTYDMDEKKKADEQRKKDFRTQNSAAKMFAKWAGGGED
jgi:hypothetical protein